MRAGEQKMKKLGLPYHWRERILRVDLQTPSSSSSYVQTSNIIYFTNFFSQTNLVRLSNFQSPVITIFGEKNYLRYTDAGNLIESIGDGAFMGSFRVKYTNAFPNGDEQFLSLPIIEFIPYV